jgi:hypothetical protein
LRLCASNPEAVVSYIDSLESKNHKKILELCALNPEIIISYIEILDPFYNFKEHLEKCMAPPKRPDLALDLYKINSDCDFLGHVYNGNEAFDAWNAYAHGYKEAITKLIEVVKIDEFLYGHGCNDTIGYPIFYLFAQYLELKMKEILIKWNSKEKKNNWKTHNLKSLWDECKKILQYMNWYEGSNFSDKERMEWNKIIETMDHFINEFAKVGNSEAFRYPVNIHDNPFLDGNPHYILNVSALSEVVDWLSYQFDVISDGIDEYWRIDGEYKQFISNL